MLLPDGVPCRWIIVVDAPFIPTESGGARESFGFVSAARAEGLVSALVVPVDPDPAAIGRSDDLEAIERLVAPAPVIRVPRRRSVSAAMSPRLPYVVASRPAPRGLSGQVRTLAPDADAVLIFSYKSYELGRVLAEDLGLPAVLRSHNLEGPYHHALADSASAPRSWVYRLEARRIDSDERRLEQSGWLSGIADISAADAAIRSARARVAVRYVPSFALGPRSRRPWQDWHGSTRPTALFLGALDVATNHDALEWFAAQVWPEVRARVPDAKWQVVGRRPSPRIVDLVARTPGAELEADVRDPATYVSKASVAVNPAVSGSGVNIKLVEYLAAGAPVVSTTRGMSGLGLAAGADLAVADSPADFAAEVVRLFRSPQQAQALGAAGRASATRILDVESSLQQLAGLFGV